jgi:hypothetical protein
MPISHREQTSLTCPACGGSFAASLWLILDTQEHPEQAEALRQHRLNIVECPHCGRRGPADTALLLHDSAARRVFFAAPVGVPEHTWREQARDLHAVLVGSIAPEARHAYLADVQVTQDVAGIAHALEKLARRQSRTPASNSPPPVVSVPEPATPAEPLPEPGEPPPDLVLEAVHRLLMLEGSEGMHDLLQEYPVLLTPAADEALEQLADVAVDQREHDLAAALHRARVLLGRARTGSAAIDGALDSLPATEADGSAEPPPPAAPEAGELPALPTELYQALLRAQHPDELQQLVQQQPTLLEPWVDTVLSQTINSVLEEGNERLAATLEERRELLTDLRAAAPVGAASETLHDAVEALLSADDEEVLAQVLLEYPALLTDEALDVLWRLSAEARTQGDDELATYAVECRAMLRRVREGLATG